MPSRTKKAREDSLTTPISKKETFMKSLRPGYRCWYYIDDNQEKQGPFTGKQIDEWHSAGHLKSDRTVIFEISSSLNDFIQLGKFSSNPCVQLHPEISEKLEAIKNKEKEEDIKKEEI